jgi:hypothetical protein
MSKRIKLTLDDHKAIARWLNDPIADQLLNKVQRVYGKSSKAGGFASKLHRDIYNIKPWLHNEAFCDGWGPSADAIYFPTPDTNQNT